ncbi:MAG: 4-hydroxy-tetrahydrodipicolinate reductase [Bacteroidetes bacterium]|nr:4-hydroxy-tetrahydrodipicolinate reductase [Bacteroidota bacterium]
MKIALIGYGKMGKAIEQIALKKGHEIVLKISEENLSDLTSANLSIADVAIEFTQPHAAYDNVLKCFAANVPVVCGTTGWYQQLEEAKKICLEKNHSFFHATNFSIGVNLFFALSEQMAKMTERFPIYNDINITETHHTQKKDAPSGTAVTLADEIVRRITRLKKWEGELVEKSSTGNSGKDNSILPVHSIRSGDAAGLHEICYQSEDDSITLIHNAKGRGGFAKGAVMAAEWLFGKKGVFGMKDLLEL